MTITALAGQAGTFEIAGKAVARLGFGSMRLTGRGIWGQPEDRDECHRERIGFIPWAPVAAGALARPGGPVDRIAQVHNVFPSQVALAWILAQSETVLPIPGTAKVAHLEENVESVDVHLTEEELDELTNAV